MRAPSLDAMEFLGTAKLEGCKTSPECSQETKVSQFTKETRREDRQTDRDTDQDHLQEGFARGLKP